MYVCARRTRWANLHAGEFACRRISILLLYIRTPRKNAPYSIKCYRFAPLPLNLLIMLGCLSTGTFRGSASKVMKSGCPNFHASEFILFTRTNYPLIINNPDGKVDLPHVCTWLSSRQLTNTGYYRLSVCYISG